MEINKQIAELREWSARARRCSPFVVPEGAFLEALDYLDECLALLSSQSQAGWVPVKERLPPLPNNENEEITYDVTQILDDESYVYEMRFSKSGRWFTPFFPPSADEDEEDFSEHDVVAWRERPAPYTSAGKGER